MIRQLPRSGRGGRLWAGFSQAYDEDERTELLEHYRENWENAWLVLVEVYGPVASFEFGRFEPDDPSGQAAWMEAVVRDDGGSGQVAFYLHYVDADVPLWYGTQRLVLPRPTPAPPALVAALPYESPD